MPEFLPEIPDEYRDAHEAAVALSQDPNLHRAFGALVGDEQLAGAAARDPSAFLKDFDVRVPDGLTVGLSGFTMPGPDWMPFTIRLSNCRTYRRINRKTGKLEEAEVCTGIEIVPNPVPGGPWG
jgi:hypothetical protein